MNVFFYLTYINSHVYPLSLKFAPVQIKNDGKTVDVQKKLDCLTGSIPLNFKCVEIRLEVSECQEKSFRLIILGTRRRRKCALQNMLIC